MSLSNEKLETQRDKTLEQVFSNATVSFMYSKSKGECFKECIADFLSDVWGILLSMLPFVGLFCLPSVVHWIGLTQIAFIIFIVLLVLLGVFFVYSFVMFILACRDDDANMKNRCLWTWTCLGVPALIGVIVANLVGFFK